MSPDLNPIRRRFIVSKALICTLPFIVSGCSADSDEDAPAPQEQAAMAPDEVPAASAEPEVALDQAVAEITMETAQPSQAAPVASAKATATASTRTSDYADGDAGGPDFWAVTGVASNDTLNIRTSASPSARIVASVPNGTVLRNLGCRTSGQSRWCRVGSLADDSVDGWVNGRFLRESGPPSTRPVPAVRPTSPQAQPDTGVPELVRRDSGEYEIRYPSGCTVLMSASGRPLNRGATCSAAQVDRASKAVAAYRREQGV